MFERAYYLSGVYDLWKPALVVGMGAIWCFLYSFMGKALNTSSMDDCRKWGNLGQQAHKQRICEQTVLIPSGAQIFLIFTLKKAFYSP